jgi:hypothetical protein
MPRTARLDIHGLLYHVIVRGIERRPIFHDDRDRTFFVERFAALLRERRPTVWPGRCCRTTSTFSSAPAPLVFRPSCGAF